MSDSIQHECGIALIRLLKPLEYYREKYGTVLYGINKLQLLMQKQRNRGQDGAGIATIKFDTKPGQRYISRKRSNSPQYLKDLFSNVYSNFEGLTEEQMSDVAWLKANKPYIGEVMMGHLRYGTHGANSIESVHPFLRLNNWKNRNLVLAGNFNLTNVNELFEELVDLGQHPKQRSDTVTVLEKIGHFLDDEVERLHSWFKPEGYSSQDLNDKIFQNLDLQRLLRRASRKFDGGYVMVGMIGHGDAFVLRDPVGIRPAYYYEDDEIVVVASERPAIQTVMNVRHTEVKEIQRGHALIIKRNGEIAEKLCKDQEIQRSCSFERIYFSRGTDRDIYNERKMLGRLLAKRVLKTIDYDLKNTIFSFIPNTAETAFMGLIEGIDDELVEIRKKKIQELGSDITDQQLTDILSEKPRVEKISIKDAKMRTFIADDITREQMVSNVYDVTYGIVANEQDTLVVIDDSIVRGTTLRDSILSNLARLKPKRIIVVSSAPQIRYPDCYGIDMSKMNNFAAFRALVNLLHDDNKEHLLDECYQKCVIQRDLPMGEVVNHVKDLYAEYTQEEISARIAVILRPKNIDPGVDIIYQTIEDLHKACPNNLGDWYFSGDYPTPGGNRIVNQAFIHYMEKKDVRAYS